MIWNDGPRSGTPTLQPDDPAARRLAGVIRCSGPLTRALAAAGVRFVIVDAAVGRGPAARMHGAGHDRPGLVVYQVPAGPAARPEPA